MLNKSTKLRPLCALLCSSFYCANWAIFGNLFGQKDQKVLLWKVVFRMQVTHSLSRDINTGSVNNVNCGVIVEVLDYLG